MLNNTRNVEQIAKVGVDRRGYRMVQMSLQGNDDDTVDGASNGYMLCREYMSEEEDSIGIYTFIG